MGQFDGSPLRNRALRVLAAVLIASVVGLIVAAAVGFCLFVVSLFVVMPYSELLWTFGSGLLLILFGVAFVISFRKTLSKLSDQ